MDKRTRLVSRGLTEKPGEFVMGILGELRRTWTDTCARDQGRNQMNGVTKNRLLPLARVDRLKVLALLNKKTGLVSQGVTEKPGEL